MGDASRYDSRDNHAQFPRRRVGSYDVEGLTPREYHTLFTQVFNANQDDYLDGTPAPQLNERAFGLSRLVYDLDANPGKPLSASSSHVKMIAFSLGQVVRLHMTGVQTSMVIVTVNAEERKYHIHLPGVMLMPGDGLAANRIWALMARMVKEVPTQESGELDMAPTMQRQIRMTGTAKVNAQFELKEESVYSFFAAFDKSGLPMGEADVRPQYYSIRPSESQVKAFMSHPVMAAPTFNTVASIKDTDYAVNEEGNAKNLYRQGEFVEGDLVAVCDGVDAAMFQRPACVISMPKLLLVEVGPERVLCRLVEKSVSGEEEVGGGEQRVVDLSERWVYRWLLKQGQLSVLPPVKIVNSAEVFDTLSGIRVTKVAALHERNAVMPDTLFDTPIMSLLYPKGFRALGADGLYVPSSASDRLTNEECTHLLVRPDYAAVDLAEYSGYPLTEAEAERIVYKEFTKSADECRTPGRTKPFMPNGFSISHLLHTAQRHIYLLQAPPDSGKTRLMLQIVKRLTTGQANPKVLVLAPLRQLCVNLFASVHGEDDELPHLESKFYRTSNVQQNKAANLVVSCINSIVRQTVDDLGNVLEYDILVADEIHSVVEAIYTHGTFEHNRRNVINHFVTLVSKAKHVIFLDKDIGPIVHLFIATCIATTKRLQVTEHNDRRMPTISIQKLILRDWVSRTVVEQTPKIACDDIIKHIADGEKTIVFNPIKKDAEKLGELARLELKRVEEERDDHSEDSNDEADQNVDGIMVITGDTKDSVKQEFSTNPLEFCAARGVRHLFHTSTLSTGVSIHEALTQEERDIRGSLEVDELEEVETDDGYFQHVYAYMNAPFGGLREILQGEARARDIDGQHPSQRTFNLVRASSASLAAFDLRDIATIGTVMHEHAVRVDNYAKVVAKRRGREVEDVCSGRLVVDLKDLTVFMTSVVSAYQSMARRLRYVHYRQWAVDQQVNIVRKVKTDKELEAIANEVEIDAEEKAEMAKKRKELSTAAGKEVKKRRLETVVVRDDDDDETRRKKEGRAAKFGVGPESPLLRDAEFMLYTENKGGDRELWNLAAFLVAFVDGRDGVNRLDDMRLAAVDKDGGARIEWYTGLTQELTLAVAALKILRLDLCPTPEGVFDAAPARMNLDVNVPVPWSASGVVTSDEFFAELIKRRFTAKRAVFINKRSIPSYTKMNGKLKELSMEEDEDKKKKLKQSILRGIVSAFFGNIWIGQNSLFTDPSKLLFRVRLLKGWAGVVAIELPARVVRLCDAIENN